MAMLNNQTVMEKPCLKSQNTQMLGRKRGFFSASNFDTRGDVRSYNVSNNQNFKNGKDASSQTWKLMTKLYGLHRNQKWVVSGPTKSINISMPCQFWSMGGTVFKVNAPINVCLCSAGIPLQKYHLTLKLRAWPSATCNWPEMYRLEALERVVEIPIPMSLEMVATL